MNQQTKNIIIMLVGAVVLALCYVFVFTPGRTEIASLQNENTLLQLQVNDLTEKVAKVDTYKSEIASMTNEIEAIENKFPSYLLVENGIMDIVGLEKDTMTYVSTLAISDPIAIAVGEPQVAEDGTVVDETPDAGLTLYGVTTDISFTTTYKGFKELANSISGSKAPMSVDSATLTYDSSNGELSGVMTFNTFFLYGTAKEYEAPYIPSMKMGTDNIFGTFDEVYEAQKKAADTKAANEAAADATAKTAATAQTAATAETATAQ